MIDLYKYCVSVLIKARKEGKPEWGLSKREKNCLRFLTSINKNFTVEERPIEH